MSLLTLLEQMFVQEEHTATDESHAHAQKTVEACLICSECDLRSFSTGASATSEVVPAEIQI